MQNFKHRPKNSSLHSNDVFQPTNIYIQINICCLILCPFYYLLSVLFSKLMSVLSSNILYFMLSILLFVLIFNTFIKQLSNPPFDLISKLFYVLMSYFCSCCFLFFLSFVFSNLFISILFNFLKAFYFL